MIHLLLHESFLKDSFISCNSFFNMQFVFMFTCDSYAIRIFFTTLSTRIINTHESFYILTEFIFSFDSFYTRFFKLHVWFLHNSFLFTWFLNDSFIFTSDSYTIHMINFTHDSFSFPRDVGRETSDNMSIHYGLNIEAEFQV